MGLVGQFLGKLFAGPSRNDAPLRAYGKLPLYAEYRRLEVSPGTPTAFSRWLDEGRLAWVKAFPDHKHGTTRATRMVVRLPDSKELVVAALWDSRDSLGRVFPITFFVVCPPEALGDDYLQRWASVLYVQESFDHCYGELARLGQGGDFYKLYEKRTVPLKPDDLASRVEKLVERSRQISAEDWLAAFDYRDAEASIWASSLIRRAERWLTQPATPASLAVSCPLAPGFPYDAQAVMWLGWLDGLSKFNGRVPWVIWPSGSSPAPSAMHVGLRDPMPDDFQLFTTDATTYGFVENLGRTPTSPESMGSGNSAPPTGSLADWLARYPLKPTS